MKAKVVIGSIVADLVDRLAGIGSAEQRDEHRLLFTRVKPVILSAIMREFPLTLSRFIVQNQALASRCDGGILRFLDPDWPGREAHFAGS